MTIQLYDYQSDKIAKIKQAMADGKKHILAQEPTGAGKTVIFSHIVKEMEKRGKRALIITDRVELLFETGGTLQQFNLHPFKIMAGQMVEPPMTHQVYVAMSQTLRRRIGSWKRFFKSFDVVIVDECHKQEFNPYFENNCFNGAFILGFSATPQRMGKQRQLADDYEILIQGLQVPELIKRGKLVPDKYYGVMHADMKGVKLNSFGDYQESGMYERFNRRELYAGVVENWQKYTPDTITLCFCVNIQHSIETCKAFNEAGITAKFIVSDVAVPIKPVETCDDNRFGTTSSSEANRVKYEIKLAEYNNYRDGFLRYSGDRTGILQSWKSRKFDVLVNAGILTTGFNRKDIETIIVNRATTSVPLWLQILGRGSRTYPGKTHFNILDFGNNAATLGYYNQQRDWSLFHEQSKGSAGAPPVKQCGTMNGKQKTDKLGNPGCEAYVYASAKVCAFCGYVFEQEREAKFADLVQIDYAQLLIPERSERNFYDELEKEAESRGYKFGWVLNQIVAKEGEEGLKAYGKSRNYQIGWFYGMKRRYQAQIDRFNEKQAELKNNSSDSLAI